MSRGLLARHLRLRCRGIGRASQSVDGGANGARGPEERNAMTTPKPRRFYPTPSWLIVALLVVECLLWLSDRLQWPTWHKGYAVLIGVAAVGVVFVVMLLWLIVALVFRVRFQFGIRSLFALTVAVALPCGWMAAELKAAREQKEAVAALEKLGGGSALYDWQFDTEFMPNAQPPEPEWLRNLLNDEFFGAVVLLLIDSDKFTDARLAQIAGLTQLQELSIYNAPITDAGLAHLARLPRLQRLWLDNTRITDAGLAQLAGLTQLQELHIERTQITDAGVKKLQQALPNCKIVHLTWPTPSPNPAGFTPRQVGRSWPFSSWNACFGCRSGFSGRRGTRAMRS